MEKQQKIIQCKISNKNFYLFIYFRFVPKNFNAIVTFELEEKFCLELYSNIKPFGRITFRDQGKTLAAGVIIEFMA